MYKNLSATVRNRSKKNPSEQPVWLKEQSWRHTFATWKEFGPQHNTKYQKNQTHNIASKYSTNSLKVLKETIHISELVIK